MNNSSFTASSSKLNITNQTSSQASNNASIFATVNKSILRDQAGSQQYTSLKYSSGPDSDTPAIDHRHSTTFTAAATAAATDKLKDEKVRRTGGAKR
jgi:hypothetical protein